MWVIALDQVQNNPPRRPQGRPSCMITITPARMHTWTGMGTSTMIHLAYSICAHCPLSFGEHPSKSTTYRTSFRIGLCKMETTLSFRTLLTRLGLIVIILFDQKRSQLQWVQELAAQGWLFSSLPPSAGAFLMSVFPLTDFPSVYLFDYQSCLVYPRPRHLC